jgi:cyclin-dependent kinase 7
MDSLREIKHLQELRHENIINLLDVFVGKSHNIHAVLEFLAGDLEGIIKDSSCVYGTGDIKSWMAMSLRGLWWCHRNFVLHRVHYPQCRPQLSVSLSDISTGY